MMVLLDQPLPSNKAAPGAAERRVGPPDHLHPEPGLRQPSPAKGQGREGVHSSHRSCPGRNCCSAQEQLLWQPWWHPATTPRTTRGPDPPASPVRPGLQPSLGKHGFPCSTARGCRGCGPTGPPLPSHLQLNPQSSAGAPGGDRAGGHTAALVASRPLWLQREGAGRDSHGTRSCSPGSHRNKSGQSKNSTGSWPRVVLGWSVPCEG